MILKLRRKRHATVVKFFLMIFSSHIAISTSESSDLDFEQYKIAWKGDISKSYLPIDYKSDSIIDISTKGNDRYKCILPSDLEQLNFDSSAKNSSSAESDESTTTTSTTTSSSSESQMKSPIQVLEPLLKSNYCSYKFELFWVYELCHGKFLRQYHEEDARYKTKLTLITQEYYLGKFDPDKINDHIQEYEEQRLEIERNGEARPTVSVHGQYKPYVMFNMTGGTKCDLTKRDRVSRILYVCNDEAKHELYSIKEISTCEYEAIVLTPALCQHKDYKLDPTSQYEIQCYSIGDAPRKPINSHEADEEDDIKDRHRRRGVAYFQGRTLIIDADLILS